jgi:hypothetical protein
MPERCSGYFFLVSVAIGPAGRRPSDQTMIEAGSTVAPPDPSFYC